jgi:hypothetical protein
MEQVGTSISLGAVTDARRGGADEVASRSSSFRSTARRGGGLVRGEEGEFAVESAAAKDTWVGEGAKGGRLQLGWRSRRGREDVGGLDQAVEADDIPVTRATRVTCIRHHHSPTARSPTYTRTRPHVAPTPTPGCCPASPSSAELVPFSNVPCDVTKDTVRVNAATSVCPPEWFVNRD